MKEKLQQLMKSEGLTSSRMAEILGIQPSGISHILAGRNKPGFDLLQKILRRFRASIRTGCCSTPNRCIEPAIRKVPLQRTEQTLEMVGLTPDCSGRNWNRDRTPPVRSLHRHKRPSNDNELSKQTDTVLQPSPQ